MALWLKNETTFFSFSIGSSDGENVAGGLWTGWISLSQMLHSGHGGFNF
jgi:hypothetical protein